MPASNKPMPSDFPKFAAVMSSEQLRLHFKTGAAQVARWRRECGVKSTTRSSGTFIPVAMPENFATLAPTMTRQAAEAFFGRGREVMKRWAFEAGISFRPNISVLSGQRQSKVRETARDMSRAGQAAEFLQRFGPVFRCTGTGQPDPKGSQWRRGSSILSNAEIIERAERNGWQPDAWKQIVGSSEGARA